MSHTSNDIQRPPPSLPLPGNERGSRCTAPNISTHIQIPPHIIPVSTPQIHSHPPLAKKIVIDTGSSPSPLLHRDPSDGVLIQPIQLLPSFPIIASCYSASHNNSLINPSSTTPPHLAKQSRGLNNPVSLPPSLPNFGIGGGRLTKPLRTTCTIQHSDIQPNPPSAVLHRDTSDEVRPLTIQMLPNTPITASCHSVSHTDCLIHPSSATPSHLVEQPRGLNNPVSLPPPFPHIGIGGGRLNKPLSTTCAIQHSDMQLLPIPIHTAHPPPLHPTFNRTETIQILPRHPPLRINTFNSGTIPHIPTQFDLHTSTSPEFPMEELPPQREVSSTHDLNSRCLRDTTPLAAAIPPRDDDPHSLSTHYGDIISLDNASTHIRFYGLNIHGISADDNYAEGQHFMEAIKLLQVDVYGLQEPNLNTSCPKIAYDVNSLFKTNDVGMKIQLSTSPELFPSRYKPGGTLTGLTSKLVGKVHSQGSDPVGRWSWITLHGKNSKKFTIITAYRVCPGNL